MGVFHIVFGIVLYFCTRTFLGWMIGNSEVEVIELGVQYMRIMYIFLFVLALLWVYRCSLQAMGDTVLPMVSGIMEFFSESFLQ